MKALAIVGLAVLAAILVIAVAVEMADEGSSPLEVRLEYGKLMYIKNVGAGPIRIRETLVNDRPECSPRAAGGRPVPEESLKVGEVTLRGSFCSGEVVRAKIKTDKGVYDYTFD
jgi:hypothetical protein